MAHKTLHHFAPPASPLSSLCSGYTSLLGPDISCFGPITSVYTPTVPCSFYCSSRTLYYSHHLNHAKAMFLQRSFLTSLAKKEF